MGVMRCEVEKKSYLGNCLSEIPLPFPLLSAVRPVGSYQTNKGVLVAKEQTSAILWCGYEGARSLGNTE